jgi:ribosomal protein S6--L-glutamate ligase
MRAAVISLGSKSSIMTIEAMRKYFDQVDQIQLKHIEISLGKNGKLLYEGKELPHYDCVLVKGSFRYANLLRSIASVLKGKVPYLPIPEECFTVAHNKLLTHLLLEQHHIPMPKTYITSTVDAAKEMLDRVSYPIVMKFPQGTQGKGVMFAESKSSAASMLDALGALNQPFIVQEYVETGGTDIRALVVGDKVIATMKRVAKSGEKRSNTHSGGSPEPVLISYEANQIAVKTAKALGADICGVDILDGPLGPVVIEVNISPGLQGISSVSTIDIPDAIARAFYDRTLGAVQGHRHFEAKKVMQSLNKPLSKPGQSIISGIKLRGDRIILPELVQKMAKLSDEKEYSIKASKGKIEIEEFNL